MSETNDITMGYIGDEDSIEAAGREIQGQIEGASAHPLPGEQGELLPPIISDNTAGIEVPPSEKWRGTSIQMKKEEEMQHRCSLRKQEGP